MINPLDSPGLSKHPSPSDGDDWRVEAQQVWQEPSWILLFHRVLVAIKELIKGEMSKQFFLYEEIIPFKK